ncbi:hypothetical protein CUMW_105030 [Citrus unshiu]|uniref:Prolyl endopeptidase n=1 Tax=Citrus unshiu TaxID=55188 RepID=A0A2H5P562_CITUN|nr:hypothetical protein CUMW_105030 [Citrus unshiu]
MLRSVFCKHTLLISTSGWLNLPRVICSSSSLSSSDSKTSTATMMSQSKLPSPPVAKKVEHKMELFGDVRVDNYYWLRDDSRSDPEVLANLKQENDYFESAMSGTKKIEDNMFAELKGRIKQEDVSAPFRQGSYYYYTRTLEGKEYVQHCRRLIRNNEAPPSVHDTMETGPDAPPEHVILDENVKAEGRDFYSVGCFQVSPDNKLVAYAEDTKGDEIYTVYIIDIETGTPVGKPLVGVTASVEWAGNEALVYITMDEILRPDKRDASAPPPEDELFQLLRVKLQDIQLFIDHLAVYEREGGLQKITTYHLPAVGEPLKSLQGGKSVEFIDPVYSIDPSESVFSSRILRFHYSSLRTPPSVYDYDMDMGISVLKKIETVLGGFDTNNYVTERKWASASDGTQIPICIVYRKNLICNDPAFNSSRLSLLDRGFIFAIAQIRGGGELGRQWYENGKFLKKKNTFTDFIACAEYLIKNCYCTKEKLCIEGRSAGGLLIGAVLNMRPDLFKAAVAGVPFVDVLTTMLDPTIPLTTAEWEEWGDPRKEEFYFYMKSYSPVDNVKAQNYPHILVTAGLNDPRVMYSEPAKFVAKLREMKTDDNILLFKCELGAGHFSKSGRFERLREAAFTYTFLMRALSMLPSVGSEQS